MKHATNYNAFAPVAVAPPWQRNAPTAVDVARPAVAPRRESRLRAGLSRIAYSASARVKDATPQHQTIYQSLGISPRGY